MKGNQTGEGYDRIRFINLIKCPIMIFSQTSVNFHNYSFVKQDFIK